jgi:hypothetical protein
MANSASRLLAESPEVAFPAPGGGDVRGHDQRVHVFKLCDRPVRHNGDVPRIGVGITTPLGSGLTVSDPPVSWFYLAEAQRTHRALAGNASSRASGITSPQSSHNP